MFTSRVTRLVRLTYFVVIISVMTGCAAVDKKKKNDIDADVGIIKSDRELTALRDEVTLFVKNLESATRITADSIERNTNDIPVRGAALAWKVEVLWLTSDVDYARDPRIRLLNCCVFTVRLLDYFTTGEGKELFGDQQPLAVQTAESLQQSVESLAREYLPDERLSEFYSTVKAKARKSPIRGLFQIDDRDFYNESASTESALSRLFNLPGSVVLIGRKALDPTSSLARSVDRFNALMDDYPSMMRREAQLLWSHLEESDSIKRTVNSIDDFSQSSVRWESVAKELPTRLREEVRLALDEAVAHQPALHETLDKIQTTLASAETVSTSIERSIGEVGKIFERTDDVPDEPGAKFDITEYKMTADAISAATIELRSLLAEFRQFADGDSLERVKAKADELTASALGQTSTELRGVIDHLWWSIAEICLLVLVLAIVYRWVSRGLLRKRT